MANLNTIAQTADFDELGERKAANRANCVQFNQLMTDIWITFANNLTGSAVINQTTLSIGTTVTIAATAAQIQINGVPVLVAALTAQAFGSLGTIPASTWGIIAMERVAAGTATFTSGAANYTTGYATEAAAKAALPAQSANKVQVGYVTILATSSGWVAGTDALQGGTGGNPATTTNYYSIPSFMTQFSSKYVGNIDGAIITT